MEIEFDIEKNKRNIASHGIDMSLADILFKNDYRVEIDDRFEYGEIREVAYGYISGREFVCVFTERGSARRIISLRKANKREVNEQY